MSELNSDSFIRDTDDSFSFSALLSDPNSIPIADVLSSSYSSEGTFCLTFEKSQTLSPNKQNCSSLAGLTSKQVDEFKGTLEIFNTTFQSYCNSQFYIKTLNDILPKLPNNIKDKCSEKMCQLKLLRQNEDFGIFDAFGISESDFNNVKLTRSEKKALTDIYLSEMHKKTDLISVRYHNDESFPQLPLMKPGSLLNQDSANFIDQCTSFIKKLKTANESMDYTVRAINDIFYIKIMKFEAAFLENLSMLCDHVEFKTLEFENLKNEIDNQIAQSDGNIEEASNKLLKLCKNQCDQQRNCLEVLRCKQKKYHILLRDTKFSEILKQYVELRSALKRNARTLNTLIKN